MNHWLIKGHKKTFPGRTADRDPKKDKTLFIQYFNDM